MFSRQAMPLVTNTSQSAVIGRLRIDNYLMGVIYEAGDLIDATTAGVFVQSDSRVVIGFHEGIDGFFNRRAGSQTRPNRNWNIEVMRNGSVHYGYVGEKGAKQLRASNRQCCTLHIHCSLCDNKHASINQPTTAAMKQT